MSSTGSVLEINNYSHPQTQMSNMRPSGAMRFFTYEKAKILILNPAVVLTLMLLQLASVAFISSMEVFVFNYFLVEFPSKRLNREMSHAFMSL